MIILSGGAKGSDTLFGLFEKHTCYHFSFEGHNAIQPINGIIVKIPQVELYSRVSELNEVCDSLKRKYPTDKFIENLLLRNMYQISNKKFKSELCIAIADVFLNHVGGGTGYAVEKAKIEKIPIFVLDKITNTWYTYSYTENYFLVYKEELDLSKYNIITGIGSREISKENSDIIFETMENMIIKNKEEYIMDIYSKGGYPSNVLSNFSPNGFTIDNVECKSMEGFLQSLKYKNVDMQIEICKMFGGGAKKRASGKKWYRDQTLYWKGIPIKRDSQEYQDLLDKAFLSIANNTKFRKALIATGNSNITHSIGKKKKNETILTEQEFCSRLLWIREKINKGEI